jgi:hypothetical protein
MQEKEMRGRKEAAARTDASGKRTVAEGGRQIREAIGRGLGSWYAAEPVERLPRRLAELLRKLEERTQPARR